MNTDSTHQHYIDIIIKKLQTAGMSDAEIKNTIDVLLAMLEQSVLEELLGRLDDEAYESVTDLIDKDATTEEISMAAEIHEEDITEAIEQKLIEYCENLDANIETLTSQLSGSL